MNVNVAYTELAGETVGFGIANGAPLQATDKHKGSSPMDTAPADSRKCLADKVAKMSLPSCFLGSGDTVDDSRTRHNGFLAWQGRFTLCCSRSDVRLLGPLHALLEVLLPQVAPTAGRTCRALRELLELGRPASEASNGR